MIIPWTRVGSGRSKKCLNSGHMIKVGQVGFAGRPDTECERKKVVKNDSKIFGVRTGTMEFFD